MIQGDIEGVKNFVRRYGDREIFLIACRRDGELNELIQMIKNDCGSINLIQQNNSVTRRGYIQLPSGEHRNFEINGELLLELPSGDNYLYFEDGLRAKFRVIPGNREIIWLPESPEDENFVAVPSDHFFMKLPEIDEFFCCVNDFEVRREPLPGEFTHQEAEQLLQNKYAGKQWRLPHLMEVHKILKDSASGSKGFYGTDFPHEGYLLLANGLFYDLKRCRMVSEVPAGRAKLLPAKSSGDLKLIRVEK
jgi:hypothetical protein